MVKNRKIFYGWWIVAAGFGTWFTGAAGPFSIVLKQLMVEFNSGRGTVSILPAIFSIAGGAGAFIASRLLKYYPPRLFLLWGSVVGGTLLLVCSVTNSLWQMFVLYLIIGSLLSGAAGAVTLIFLISKWFDKKRGLAIGIASAGMAIGILILTPIVGAISANFGWRPTYLFAGALVLIVNVPLIAVVMKNSPEEMGLLPDGAEASASSSADFAVNSRRNSTGMPMPLSIYLKRPATWLIIASFLLIPMSVSAISQHQVSFITDMGISPIIAATAMGFTGGIGGLSVFGSGWLCDKIRIKHVMPIFMAITLISIVILIKMNSIPMLWLFVLFFGLGGSASSVVFPLVINDVVGPEGFISVFGFANIAFCLGFALGPPLAGYIFDMTGSYFTVFIIAGVLNILAIAMIYTAYAIKQKPVKIVEAVKYE